MSGTGGGELRNVIVPLVEGQYEISVEVFDQENIQLRGASKIFVEVRSNEPIATETYNRRKRGSWKQTTTSLLCNPTTPGQKICNYAFNNDFSDEVSGGFSASVEFDLTKVFTIASGFQIEWSQSTSIGVNQSQEVEVNKTWAWYAQSDVVERGGIVEQFTCEGKLSGTWSEIRPPGDNPRAAFRFTVFEIPESPLFQAASGFVGPEFPSGLDSSWRLSVNGQSSQSGSYGTLKVRNVSAPDLFGPDGPGSRPDFVSDDYVRVTGVSTQGGTNRYAFSEFFQIRQGQTTFINDLTFTDTPPRKPESLTLLPETRLMTGALGQTNRVRVIARFADATTNNVAAKTAWTTYRVSNPAIVTVTPDGEVVSKARGVVYVTAVNEGATATVQIGVSPDDSLTTVVGIVRDTNGVAVAGATVSVGALGLTAVTDAEGRFSIGGVPTGLGAITVTAVLLRTGATPLVAVSTLAPRPGGLTDAGVMLAQPGFPGMAYIPPGTFVMGSPNSERERSGNETQHTVTLTNGFWVGQNEVTQGEWVDVVGNSPSYFRNGQTPTNGGTGGPVTNELRHPVERVSWTDATNYCVRLTARERLAGRIPADYAYRLPTEAEWEYACRGGTTSAFHYGKALRGGMANFNAYYEYDADVGEIFLQTTTNYLGRTSMVESYTPNAHGLKDMHGNVWEWCSDWYGDYPSGSVTNPVGPATGIGRVYRGGSWITGGWGCRSAYRGFNDPGFRLIFIGFRVVLAPGR